MFQATVICDSVSPLGQRLTTFEIEFPRIVLAEVVTHRVNSDSWFDAGFCDRTTDKWISKNSASSQAIPFHRLLKKVLDDPYVPDRFSKNGPGMVPQGYFEGEAHQRQVKKWLQARDAAVKIAVEMADDGVHKGDVNRLLEPWGWVKQVVTSARWPNFFALRCHRDAHHAFQKIARMMYCLYQMSQPVPVPYGEWHLPYVRQYEYAEARAADGSPRPLGSGPMIERLLDTSAARCAWTSYWSPDGAGSPEKVRSTVEKLKGSDPKHASPFEHQATPMSEATERDCPHLRSNLLGWLQYRKLIAREQATDCSFSREEVASWGIDEESLYERQRKWKEEYEAGPKEARAEG